MVNYKKILWPVSMGLAAMVLQGAVFFGLLSWAGTPQHALEVFQQERWLILALFLGFGLQVALFTILKKRLFIPSSELKTSTSAAMTGVGGTTSTVAMVACCVHHVTDVLPILGLTAAATFLANYQSAFMLGALIMTYLGILVMVSIVIRSRRKAILHLIPGRQTS